MKDLKTSLLIARPTLRDAEDPPEVPVQKPIAPPVTHQVDTAHIQSDEFGDVAIPLVSSEPKRKLWTSVPLSLVQKIQHGSTSTEFICEAVKLVVNLQEVLNAIPRMDAYHLRENRVVASLSGFVPLADVERLERAVKMIKTHRSKKASVNALVGGCVMLLAEKKGFVEVFHD